MTGILKVIHGSISVQSYTMKQPPHFTGEQNVKILGSKKPFQDVYPAVKHPCVKVTSSDPACIVTPDSHNLHEISSVGGLAAFLDILSPPYGIDQRNGEERDCHYYEEINVPLKNDMLPSDSVLLIKVPTPLEFWCDQAEYKGPPVTIREFVNGQNNS
ncbi:2-aminoethanethiol dioxygenase [Armadillidium nasatum]|uniref:2-aminoethanethiol dioxygenase n=1 Tax=Armadillidium nasatum TaxID=96803 RepID=A0A5N5TNU2_9CRUS|nr:2-aminoethanethiol dioxygenase [Armadillidium nasatum]